MDCSTIEEGELRKFQVFLNININMKKNYLFEFIVNEWIVQQLKREN